MRQIAVTGSPHLPVPAVRQPSSQNFWTFHSTSHPETQLNVRSSALQERDKSACCGHTSCTAPPACTQLKHSSR